MNTKHAEIAVIGAGILGLAHAYIAAKRGYKVVLFERMPQAVGASIRNFGLVWPIGQPAGLPYERALRGRAHWIEVARQAKLWCNQNGSLQVAYHADEFAVLEEFAATLPDGAEPCQLLTPEQVLRKSRAVNSTGLKGGFFSSTELTVDPREAIRQIPQWLSEVWDVNLRFGTAVNAIRQSTIETLNETWQFERAIVCTGADFETLYPDLFAVSGITRVKLQMMRTKPQPGQWQLGPTLCAGLTLIHYDAFKRCQALSLLIKRLQHAMPEYIANGIHVLLAQNAMGELIVGDSHEYGLHIEPFDKENVNQLILNYLRTFAHVPTLDIAERWHGVYAKLPDGSEFVRNPAPNVTIISPPGGAGMTFAFGLAEETFA
jgi:FAD dependent oxidoreductase TIGR03364